MLDVAESIENLERRIDDLRAAVRRAVVARDQARARALRAELRSAERDWERALTDLADDTPDAGQPAADEAPLVSVRDQVHHALTLLSAPTAPKLIAEVHNAFFGAAGPGLAAAKLTHLRRDEERSFRTARHSRPYYLCSALTAEHLAPARGLLGVSTWPLERRIISPLSPRVDFLTAAIKVAEQVGRMPERTLTVARLLRRFATSIPGAVDGHEAADPAIVIKAAHAELEVHADADRAQRVAAADRARAQLDEAEQLFGSRLRVIRGLA
ncbi:hypothetical protein SAMN04489832_5847 [Micromonospora cremea]|uniref:Uncharacterized protein n=1 Tax=Micromonospora cremea TaxID=709881 RepID=A0A1N6ANT4_9ACTN|nr:hypothetical protein [Micromonospora cremea]SIN35681.1 hypothetical protein SAMN04489832_5847 [Micromonospora cremea]